MENQEVKTEETKKSFSLPYKVKCSVCGKEKSVRHEVLLKRLVGLKGTVEERFNLHILTYKCQECKRVQKMREYEKDMM